MDIADLRADRIPYLSGAAPLLRKFMHPLRSLVHVYITNSSHYPTYISKNLQGRLSGQRLGLHPNSIAKRSTGKRSALTVGCELNNL